MTRSARGMEALSGEINSEPRGRWPYAHFVYDIEVASLVYIVEKVKTAETKNTRAEGNTQKRVTNQSSR